MEAAQSALPGGGAVGKVIFVILALVALYYLYQFLFGPTGLEGKQITKGIQQANPDKPYVTFGPDLPAIYEGGEYSLNFWIYINDYSVNRGQNKHVISIGGSSFLTLAVFLGPYKNTLAVRVHTRDGSTSTVRPAATTGNIGPTSQSDDLSTANMRSLFGTLQNEGSLVSSVSPCDLTSVELQKWIQVTVCLNNKTCDVYMDGKLARSCVLPSFFRVDKSNLALAVTDYKGFGGYVSNVSAYNYALNPEQVWRLYMTGPGPQYSFMDYVKSLFDPKALGSLDYPKQNITQNAV
jgi:hypothetical protein